jgi:hypothetical protein
MIEQFINYISHNPTDETSPLFLELNTTAMLLALGNATEQPDKVRIYDSNAQEGNSPYVKLYDKGQRQRMATFLGGSYTEKQTLVCECVALGASALSAIDRAELLKLAVEGEVKKLQSGIMALTTRTDLGGTASTETVVNLQIGSVDQETPVSGQKEEFTATRTALIELLVFKGRYS